MQVNILGTTYDIVVKNKEEEPMFGGEIVGFCDNSVHKIVISSECVDTSELAEINEDLSVVYRETLRHEIVHAFIKESGLGAYSQWAENEEMVEWVAVQFPKLLKAFLACGALVREEYTD